MAERGVVEHRKQSLIVFQIFRNLFLTSIASRNSVRFAFSYAKGFPLYSAPLQVAQTDSHCGQKWQREAS
jgi:hypothetical protein